MLGLLRLGGLAAVAAGLAAAAACYMLTAHAEIAGTLGVLHSTPRTVVTPHATDQVDPDSLANGIPVQPKSSRGVEIFSLSIPAQPGDLLKVTAWGRFTNDTTILVGSGWQLWGRDANDPDLTWFKLSTACGDNLEVKRHHIPISISTLYPVPADWPAGHRLVVMLWADAHSTAYAKAVKPVTVDPLGMLAVEQYA